MARSAGLGGPSALTQNVVAPRVKGIARGLRRRQTPHEGQLWALLRHRRFVGYKFRRQVPIGPYVVDFVCQGRRPVVELDGRQHADSQRDAIRDAELRRRGYRVLRIWNNDPTGNRNAVFDAVWAALQERTGMEVDGGEPLQ